MKTTSKIIPMKKYILLSLLLLLLSPMAKAQTVGENDTSRIEVLDKDVAFKAVRTEDKHLTDAQKNALYNKLERILAKNHAGVTGDCEAFGIKADIEVLDKKTTAGLVRNVTVMTAEVTLTAFNLKDGSIYYTHSVKLETDVVGDSQTAMDKLIQSIKVTDPQFVRFIRTSRKRIAQWYNEHGQTFPMLQERREEKTAADTTAVSAPSLAL